MPSEESVARGSSLRVHELLRCAADALKNAGIEMPEREARLLLDGILGISSLDVLKEPDRSVAAEACNLYRAAFKRRTLREPVSRILGRRSFYGREFVISPATLDPRPETETLVECILDEVEAGGGRDRPLNILDVGTGTGCILLTLLSELPCARGLGTDISPEALLVAQTNARRMGVSERAAFLQCRTLERVAGPFDVLVSNPPYIPSGDIAALEDDVRLFDPHLALDGGADGCDVFRALGARLGQIVPDGFAAFEVGAGQASTVSEIINPGQRLREERRRDLGGHERVVAVWTQL